MMPLPVELEARFIGFVEEDVTRGNDWATWSSLSLSWRFAAARSVMFRTGLGYQNWFEDAEEQATDPLSDAQRVAHGADFHYGFDAFIAQPLILSAEGRLGVLGAAGSWQLRGTLGAALGPFELFAGYHALAIGGVSLGGPVGGLRGWW